MALEGREDQLCIGLAVLPTDFLDQLKAAYPKRDGAQGWAAIPRLFAAYTMPDEWQTILLGTQQYAIHCGRKGMVRTEYVMQARTFYGRDRHWEEWAEMDLRTPHQIAQDARWADLEARAVRLGFTTVDRQRGYDVALRAVEQAERENERRVVERTGLRLVVGK